MKWTFQLQQTPRKEMEIAYQNKKYLLFGLAGLTELEGCRHVRLVRHLQCFLQSDHSHFVSLVRSFLLPSHLSPRHVGGVRLPLL